MTRWKIGQATITRIEEQLGPSLMPPEKQFPGFEREVLERHLDWLVPHHYDPRLDCVVSSIHSWLIQTPRHTILLDGCCGNHKERPWVPRFHQLDTPFLERLQQAGAAPGDIDIVFCTHLHADHVGWNTVLRDGRWVPTFPNARYVFSKTEADYWNLQSNPGLATDPRRVVFNDSVLPVIQSGQAQIIGGGHQLEDDLLIEPAPGHTPGLAMLILDGASTHAASRAHGERAVFCGDVMHHALQMHAPHWAHNVDSDPAQAKITRRRVLEQCAETGALLFPTHFGAPHVAGVVEVPGSGGKEFAPRFVEGRV